jgi:type IV secretory pathway VirB10-like protein
MIASEHPTLNPPPITTPRVNEFVVEVMPSVAYPDRPWVMVAIVAGAVALGSLVFETLISGQKAADVSGFVPTRDARNDKNLGAPVPQAPDLFAHKQDLLPITTPAVAPLIMPSPTSVPSSVPPQNVQSLASSPEELPIAPSPVPPPITPSPVLPTLALSPTPSPVGKYTNLRYSPSPVSAESTDTGQQGASGTAADLGRRMRSPALIIDLSTSVPPGIERGPPSTVGNSEAGDNALELRSVTRETGAARADSLRNPKAVVPQGVMIAAVLETAINSDLPGFVRALVSRDVASVDGSRILIPRGSRLVGQYKSEVELGQSRAFVIWTRLMRPDGVSVQLTSPGTDTLGRAGLDGHVDRHFLQRFGPSLLTSAITATQSGSNRSNLLVIGTTQSAGAVTQGDAIKPTVIVSQGTSIQVFVARDLDFSNVP